MEGFGPASLSNPFALLTLYFQSAKLLYHSGCHSEAIEALSAAVLYKQRNPNFPTRNSNNNDAMRLIQNSLWSYALQTLSFLTEQFSPFSFKAEISDFENLGFKNASLHQVRVDTV